jgi:N-sulfoglucosamine sulfohydrolase
MRQTLSILALLLIGLPTQAAKPLNILWLIGEDLGPELGCYGDVNAITPNIDKLASQGARYTHCYTHAPVCAPSRSGLVTGQYPIKIGTHHMRSTLLKPPPLFTDHLRKAGYTIYWPTKSPFGKTDFNFELPPKFSDQVTDWRKSELKEPFFAYFNITTSHESQIRANPDAVKKNLARLKPSEMRDPAKMKLPSYYPDAPETRRDLANYYNVATAVDYTIGDVLKHLDDKKLAENTVVIFFGDHGRGLPRSKRWCYEQGTHTPLIVRWPGQLKPGSVNDELVAFVDLPATTLALANAAIPAEFDGQAFLGEKRATPRKYIYAARDRMDETPDRIRAIRDSRYRYVRNFQPELPYAQVVSYMELMPTMKVWRDWHAQGKLNSIQAQFFAEKKPLEELYDVETDPDEVNNLAGNPKYKEKQAELAQALDEWVKKTNDLGAIPERELIKRGLVADRLKEYDMRKKP